MLWLNRSVQKIAEILTVKLHEQFETCTNDFNTQSYQWISLIKTHHIREVRRWALSLSMTEVGLCGTPGSEQEMVRYALLDIRKSYGKEKSKKVLEKKLSHHFRMKHKILEAQSAIGLNWTKVEQGLFICHEPCHLWHKGLCLSAVKRWAPGATSCDLSDKAPVCGTGIQYGLQLETWMLYFRSAPCWYTEASSRRWSKSLDPCIYMGELEEAPGCWLWLGAAPNHCSHLRSKAADESVLSKRKQQQQQHKNVVSLRVCMSVCLTTFKKNQIN